MNKARYELRISAEIRDTMSGYGGLSLTETITVDAQGFMEVAQILAQFHELGKKFEQEKNK